MTETAAAKNECFLLMDCDVYDAKTRYPPMEEQRDATPCWGQSSLPDLH